MCGGATGLMIFSVALMWTTFIKKEGLQLRGNGLPITMEINAA